MRELIGTGVVFAALCLPGAPCQAEQAFVSLRASVSLDRPELRLGDVADIVARRPEVADRLAKLELTRLPTLARPHRFSRNEIADFLAQRDAAAAEGLLWGGSGEVGITGRRRAVSLADATDTAAALLMERLAGPGKVALRLEQGKPALEVPPGQVRIRPLMAEVHQVGGRLAVPLAVEVDGALVGKPTVQFTLSRIAASGDSAGDAEQMLQTAAKPAKRQAADAAANGKAATALPSPGSEGDQSQRPTAESLAVERDKPVRILIDAGAVQIESEGLALANARLGERVRVRRGGNGGEFFARATRPGLVLVEDQ